MGTVDGKCNESFVCLWNCFSLNMDSSEGTKIVFCTIDFDA